MLSSVYSFSMTLFTPPSLSSVMQLHDILYGDNHSLAEKWVSRLNSYFPIMNPHNKVVQRWNQFFLISCLVAIFIDPLFFFLLSVRKVCFTYFTMSFFFGTIICHRWSRKNLFIIFLYQTLLSQSQVQMEKVNTELCSQIHEYDLNYSIQCWNKIHILTLII